jgi:hypothetical protein
MAIQEPELSRAVWRKSARSNNGGACVEVATNLPAVVAVRDSKDPDGGVLRFGPDEWTAFLEGIRTGSGC